jgi:hypothetical protein
MQFGLYLRFTQASDALGWVIVGTHHLVSTPSRKLKPFLAWLGIVFKKRVPPNSSDTAKLFFTTTITIDH